MLVDAKSALVALILGSAPGLHAQSATTEDSVQDYTAIVHTENSRDDGQRSPAAVTGSVDASNDHGTEAKSLFHTLVGHFQAHGTFSQGFIYSSGNNYLSMHTDDGSARWSEGAINFRTAARDNLHLGLQLHSYVMGELGRGTVQLDWAFADYKKKSWLGFRGGKLKAPLGLFGEFEDTDTLYNWALLPQSMYESEFRSYNVPVIGGEVYGSVDRGRNQIRWEFIGGRRSAAGNDGGWLLAQQLYGIEVGHSAGYTYGANLKWEMPVRGLTAGVFFDYSRLISPDAYWPISPYGVPLHLKIDSNFKRTIYSLRFQRDKLDLAAEGKWEPHWVANNGIPVVPGGSPRQGWYVMGAYHFTNRFTAGSYFSRMWGTSFIETFRWIYYDPKQPEFYSNDTVLNARFDVSRFVYLKLEGHYISGNLGGFFPNTNPNGLQKVTRLAIARFGVTF